MPFHPSGRRLAPVPLPLALLVAFSSPACRRQPVASGAIPRDAPGVYTLVAVAAKPVPATVSHDDTPLEIRSGSMTLDGTACCRSPMVFAPGGGREVVREVEATCTRGGGDLVLRWKGAGTTRGALHGGEFVMTHGSMALTCRK